MRRCIELRGAGWRRRDREGPQEVSQLRGVEGGEAREDGVGESTRDWAGRDETERGHRLGGWRGGHVYYTILLYEYTTILLSDEPERSNRLEGVGGVVQ